MGLGLGRGWSVSGPESLATSVVPATVGLEHQLGWWVKVAIALALAPACRLSAENPLTLTRGGPQVSLTADFSACRVYWRTPPPAEQNAHTQATLQRHAARMR